MTRFRSILALTALGLVLQAYPRWTLSQDPISLGTSASGSDSAESHLDLLRQMALCVPRDVGQCRRENVQRLDELAERIDEWAARTSRLTDDKTPRQVLDAIEKLLSAKKQVDRALVQTLAIRTKLGMLPADDRQKGILSHYLRTTTRLIDLTGRLRYLLRDAIDAATYATEDDPGGLDRLLDTLIRFEESIGAKVLSFALFDPEPDAELRPYPVSTKKKVLRLIAASRSSDLVEELADFLVNSQDPALIVEAAAILRQIGLPQDARAGQDPTLPKPVITARQLDAVLADDKRFPVGALTGELESQHSQLRSWLGKRIKNGVTEDHYACGRFQVRAGDWLLMRNPSPYNLFTDLSPGLFTHVGVVAVERGADGVRRFVIVDLPERGSRIPATNVDIYLQRSLHFFFLRHQDAPVCDKMGQVALDVIGNETQFDLLFRTERVEALRGKPLKGQRIHTYCAGFLLMCAQETTAPKSDFFPIAENPAGGFCLKNLDRLGLSIGKNFVSPSGAVFSSKMKLVGSREPMYHPGREVEEAVYDHFAKCMIGRTLKPSPDAYQALRQKLAELSKHNPLLAKALARANNVSEHLDLASAAKAAAVIETLDEIARGNSAAFFAARHALRAESPERLKADGLTSQEIASILEYQREHAELRALWLKEELTPRRLRVDLVRHYSQRGRRQLEERFFPVAASP